MAVEVRDPGAAAGALPLTAVPGWAARYVGLPFADGGRDFRGVDCEGLCRLVMQREAGDPPIPPYGILSADGLVAVARAIGKNAALPPWVSVQRDELRPFDWVLMTARERVGGRPCSIVAHCGVMITGALVLHVEVATHSVVVPLDHHTVNSRLAGFVRHEALTGVDTHA